MTSQLLTGQRHAVIRERLSKEGRVIAASLAHEFQVSEDTVRRDLRELAASGLCERVYGGALPIAPRTGTLAERSTQATHAKRRLAQAAAKFVETKMTLFIDAGSTNVAVAANLPACENLTVVTNSPAVALAVPSRRGTDVVLLGGRYDPGIGACVGAKTLTDAARFRPDLVVLGACGLDPAIGVTAFSQEEAELKRLIALSGQAVMVVSTREKLGTAAPFVVVSSAGLTRLVTDAGADQALLAGFESAGSHVVRVNIPQS